MHLAAAYLAAACAAFVGASSAAADKPRPLKWSDGTDSTIYSAARLPGNGEPRRAPLFFRAYESEDAYRAGKSTVIGVGHYGHNETEASFQTFVVPRSHEEALMARCIAGNTHDLFSSIDDEKRMAALSRLVDAQNSTCVTFPVLLPPAESFDDWRRVERAAGPAWRDMVDHWEVVRRDPGRCGTWSQEAFPAGILMLIDAIMAPRHHHAEDAPKGGSGSGSGDGLHRHKAPDGWLRLQSMPGVASVVLGVMFNGIIGTSPSQVNGGGSSSSSSSGQHFQAAQLQLPLVLPQLESRSDLRERKCLPPSCGSGSGSGSGPFSLDICRACNQYRQDKGEYDIGEEPASCSFCLFGEGEPGGKPTAATTPEGHDCRLCPPLHWKPPPKQEGHGGIGVPDWCLQCPAKARRDCRRCETRPSNPHIPLPNWCRQDCPGTMPQLGESGGHGSSPARGDDCRDCDGHARGENGTYLGGAPVFCNFCDKDRPDVAIPKGHSCSECPRYQLSPSWGNGKVVLPNWCHQCPKEASRCFACEQAFSSPEQFGLPTYCADDCPLTMRDHRASFAAVHHCSDCQVVGAWADILPHAPAQPHWCTSCPLSGVPLVAGSHDSDRHHEVARAVDGPGTATGATTDLQPRQILEVILGLLGFTVLTFVPTFLAAHFGLPNGGHPLAAAAAAANAPLGARYPHWARWASNGEPSQPYQPVAADAAGGDIFASAGLSLIIT